MKLSDILSRDAKFKNNLLGRLISDCDYYLCCPDNHHLWAGSPAGQVAYMLAIWESMEDKPGWTTLENIFRYADLMNV